MQLGSTFWFFARLLVVAVVGLAALWFITLLNLIATGPAGSPIMSFVVAVVFLVVVIGGTLYGGPRLKEFLFDGPEL